MEIGQIAKELKEITERINRIYIYLQNQCEHKFVVKDEWTNYDMQEQFLAQHCTICDLHLTTSKEIK